MNARQAAVGALQKIDREGAYSNIVVDAMVRENAFSAADRGLAVRLVYGTLERRLTIDYLLRQCSTVPLNRIHPVVLQILRTAVFQLVYADKIPASAAVNEAVELTRKMKQPQAAGFVNGVLRGVARRYRECLEQLPNGREGEAVRYSCPPELIAMWKKAYGEELTLELLEHLSDAPDQCIRVNTLRISEKAFERELQENDIPFTKDPDLPACFHFFDTGRLKSLANLGENCYYHQDAASQYACLALGAQPGERVADVCAAPGGKSFTLAQYMENQGELLAGELHAARCDMMERRATMLGLSVVRTVARDASKPCPIALEERFDRVLCDVPCSGLGVIRRKPEIRYKPLDEFTSLPATQLAILEQSARMVKPGGVLQYSTCTLRPAENEKIVRAFLEGHPEFAPRALPTVGRFVPEGHCFTMFPHIHHTDGFFVAGFARRG